MQKKKRAFSFHFRVPSKFGEAKVTKKREQNKINSFIFYAECSNFGIAKVTKNDLHQQNQTTARN